MDFGLYQRIINEVKDFASSITLAVNGESLLHPKFFEMIRYGSKNGIKMLLNTNATLLNKENSKQLLDSGVNYISFAFDGYTKSMYENARLGADFEQTLNNILTFLQLMKKSKKKSPYCVLSILMLGIKECSPEEKQVFLDQFRGLIDEVRQREVSTWGSTFKGTDKFSYRDNITSYPPCSRLWTTLCIGYNGDVLPCVYNANHEYLLGNLRNNRLTEIWNGEKMLRLRRAMLDGSYLQVFPLCENCIVLGTRPVLGVPSGIRLSLSDALTNITGYRLEKFLLWFANKLSGNKFTTVSI